MKRDNFDSEVAISSAGDDGLLASCRRALTPATPPSPRALEAIARAAREHAAGRGGGLARWWALWRGVALAAGGAAAAVALLLAALPYLATAPAADERGQARDDPAITALALLTLTAGSPPEAQTYAGGAEFIAGYFLSYQEAPGGFERADALYAASE